MVWRPPTPFSFVHTSEPGASRDCVYDPMGKENELVLVLDADGHMLEYIEPAVARRALREGLIKVAASDPFTVQVPRGMSRVPRLFKGRGVAKMAFDKFRELFSEEKSIYIKTIVPGQVSFEIQSGSGQATSVTVPHSGDPICLTDMATFEAISRCMDLRKLASPRPVAGGGLKPPAVRIMTEDEVHEYYAAKATRKGWFTPDGQPDVMRAAQPKYTHEAITVPSHVVKKSESDPLEADSESTIKNIRNKQLTLASGVHPKVIHLCGEASNNEIPENERPSADQMIEEFEMLGVLNVETLNHIQAFGVYKTVKKWATKVLEEQTEGAE